MAKLNREELEEIIQRDAPGHRIVARGQPDDAIGSAVSPDEGSPDLASLRKKFLGPNAAGDGRAGEAGAEEADAAPDADDVEMVTIEPDQRDSPWDHGSRAKTVIVSGKERRIIGSQG